MVSKRDAVNLALQAALDSWNWRPPPNPDALPLVESAASRGLFTDSSVTVFSGDLEEWVTYLRLSQGERYEPAISVRAHVQPELRLLVFDAESEDARWLSDILNNAYRRLAKRVEGKPYVARALAELLFEGGASRLPTLVRLSPHVPSDGTRESDGESPSGDVRVVLHSRLARYVREALANAGDASADERLGYAWPLISRVVSALAYPASARDRFAVKIRLFAKMSYVALNVLYESRKSGELVPGVAGAVYENMVSASSGVARNRLTERHPYFRMLSRLGFMLRAEPYSHYAGEAEIGVREYLDSVYLRLSLAGAMPGVAEAAQPMSFERKGRKVRTERPEVGRFGILDRDDLDAWKTVADPFQDLGFALLRQVGMGEFGRVYEALNDNNPNWPARVALKVDRIIGKKKNAILEAEAAMEVGRRLAGAHHIIRIYDTGKLKGQRFTYHVLQLIDGDTLDDLVGVTGTEHASVSRP
ncbi:MAG TPA: serine/threonine-protein kinase, partial [Polyangiaceae bacterium]|nr:serine/threonine-protein kinase [Polyangiaceae bacterium]